MEIATPKIGSIQKKVIRRGIKCEFKRQRRSYSIASRTVCSSAYNGAPVFKRKRRSDNVASSVVKCKNSYDVESRGFKKFLHLTT